MAASTSSVALELSVGTARPIVLYSDLAKTPVPVAVGLKLEKPSGRMTGAVEFKTFDVEFFRRRATVDHLTLTFRPGSKRVGLDGLIKYKSAEAMIGIRLLGTMDKPQVVFESDPPLNQSDIIGLLVFGKSPDELDADQAATVANTQTAMSDKAFGLASLYLFASTPIQFVGYDPATKSYTMKFRIPGGETLSLNSDFDATKSVQPLLQAPGAALGHRGGGGQLPDAGQRHRHFPRMVHALLTFSSRADGGKAGAAAFG